MYFPSKRLFVPLFAATLLSGLLFAGTDAAAQTKANRSTEYAVTFDKVVDNCDGKGLTLFKSSITVSQTADALSITVPDVPTLKGVVGRRGKLRANAKGTKAPATKANYEINGRVTGSRIQAVFMVEYFKGKKPLCTQSWSVAGNSK